MESILGLGACPLCGSETQIGWQVEDGEVLFRAICKNSSCGCNAGPYKSIRETQDHWNKVDVNRKEEEQKGKPKVPNEDGYTYTDDRLPSFKESVFQQNGGVREYCLMDILTEDCTYELVGYYDSKDFRRMDNNDVIRNVKCYKVIPARYALISKKEADNFRN